MFQKILVPLDGSPLAESALPYAVELARKFDATLILVRVVPPILAPTIEYATSSVELSEALYRQQVEDATLYLRAVSNRPELSALEVRTLRRDGPIAEAVLDVVEAEGIDTIVMATHGRGGFARWVLGSVADRLVRSSPVPVLLVRAGMREVEEK